MSLIRTFAAQKLADYVASRVVFAERPTVIAAPPSERSVYPAFSVMIERSRYELSMDDVVTVDPTKQPGDDGYELSGVWYTDPDTHDVIDGDTYLTDDGRALSHIGTLQIDGQLWIAARNPSQREAIEEKIEQLFFDDDAAPGRLMFRLAGATIGGITMPFGVGTAEIDKSDWTGEHVFEARLWSHMPYRLDLPMVVPRNDAILKQLILAFSTDLATPITNVADLSKLSDLRQLVIGSDGSASDVVP